MAALILGMLIIYLCIFLVDGLPTIRKRAWRELVVFLFLLTIAIFLSLWGVLGQPKKGLATWLEPLLEPLARVVLGP